MQANQQSRPRISGGDIVSHATYGLGHVIEVIGTDPPRKLVIDFEGKPSHQMSYELAVKSLVRLPEHGLAALLRKQPETARRWVVDAPLRLIAAALADFGRSARPSELASRLARSGILDSNWEGWWKRVQPELKRSPHFSQESGGYRLRTSVDEVPEAPLQAPPIRAKLKRLDSKAVLQLVTQIESGQTTIGSVEAAINVRLVARQLIRNARNSDGAHHALVAAAAGPVVSSRAVLEELLQSQERALVLEFIGAITVNAILFLDSHRDQDKSRLDHVRALATLLHKAVVESADWLVRRQSSEVQEVAKALLDLAVVVDQRSDATWATDTLASLAESLAALVSQQLELIGAVSTLLATMTAPLNARVSVLSRLLGALPHDARPAATRSALLASLTGSPEFARLVLVKQVKGREQQPVLMGLCADILLSRSLTAAQAAAKLLSSVARDSAPEGSLIRTSIALALCSSSREVGEDLQSLLTSDLLSVLTSETDAITDDRPSQVSGPVRAALQSVISEILAHERQEFEVVWLGLEQQLSACSQKLQATEQDRATLLALTNRLQTGYRLPEQLSAFKGKQEVVQDVADLYQETFLSRQIATDAAPLSWLLIRLEGVLRKQGVEIFGNIDSREPYDPSRHEFISEAESAGNAIVLHCPGLQWSDPNGKSVLIRRARGVAATEDL